MYHYVWSRRRGKGACWARSSGFLNCTSVFRIIEAGWVPCCLQRALVPLLLHVVLHGAILSGGFEQIMAQVTYVCMIHY